MDKITSLNYKGNKLMRITIFLQLFLFCIAFNGCISNNNERLTFNNKNFLYITKECQIPYLNKRIIKTQNILYGKFVDIDLTLKPDIGDIFRISELEGDYIFLRNTLGCRLEVVSKLEKENIELIDANVTSFKNKDLKLHSYFLITYTINGIKIIRFDNMVVYYMIKDCITGDKTIFDKRGFNKKGINKITESKYDERNFDVNGLDRTTLKKFNLDGFNLNGIHKNTKTNYDERNFDFLGVHKITGKMYDEKGFNSLGQFEIDSIK